MLQRIGAFFSASWYWVLVFAVMAVIVFFLLQFQAALREHKSVLAEYTDWRVILGYALFVGCTLLTMLAYKGVPLNVGPVLEATGYIYVTIFGVTIFHEKMNPKKLAALAMILVGILVYAL